MPRYEDDSQVINSASYSTRLNSSAERMEQPTAVAVAPNRGRTFEESDGKENSGS
jgi:hypothetical protein